MTVYDLWMKGPKGGKVPSARHGRGKRYRVANPGTPTNHFDRKVDAERYDLKVRGDLATGQYVDPLAGRQTFRAYAEAWRAMQPHRHNTAYNTQSRLTHHVYPVLGARPIAAIKPSEIQAFVGGLTVELAPGSIRTLMGTLSAVFNAAVRDNVRTSNPCDGVKAPTVHRKRIVPLTVEQVEALIDGLPDRYRALGIVAAGTGMRPAELFGLQVRDVDFLRKVIRVERQVQPSGVGPLKNRSAYRAIPVGDTVIDALAKHLATHPAQGEEFIFRTPDGRPVHRGVMVWPWRLARRAAGLPRAVMRDFRHFYASALIRAGLSVKVVSERLGHSNAAMTLNTYSHLWADDEDRTRQAIDDVLGRKIEAAVYPRLTGIRSPA